MLILGPLSWEFFLAERTFHQVMPIFRVPRNLPPLGLSFESIIMDDPAYTTGSFDAYMDTSKDYANWFAESSTGPIIKDVPVSEGRVLGGIIRAQVASRANWRLCVKVIQARIIELETTAATREVHMQEETVHALAWEREFGRGIKKPILLSQRESGANFRVS